MIKPMLSLVGLAGLVLAQGLTPAATEPVTRSYRVRQQVMLTEIPKDSKDVRWWIAVPDDDRYQQILDLSVVSAPGEWKFVREGDHGNRFLAVHITAPTTSAAEVTVEFTVRRRASFVDIDATRVGILTNAQRHLFAEELRRDAPHMEVTPTIQKVADDACGKEANLYTQCRTLLERVATIADHYSKDPTKPKCGVGDAGNCLANGGGCCTDLHSLFIALARARGIPARLQMGYRLLEKNEGKEVDPGYRCWPEYFLPGYGWVAADVVEADAPEGTGQARWYTGLSERRLWLNEGREFDLTPRKAAARVNTMVIGYAEIDGVPARVLPEGDRLPQLSRKILFTSIPPSGPTALSSSNVK